LVLRRSRDENPPANILHNHIFNQQLKGYKQKKGGRAAVKKKRPKGKTPP
jgi:hypothetical protein